MQSTIHKSLEITIMQSNVTSLPGSLYVCFALCNCSRTHTDVLTWCYIVGYSTYTITAHRVCVLRTLVVELIAVVSNDWHLVMTCSHCTNQIKRQLFPMTYWHLVMTCSHCTNQIKRHEQPSVNWTVCDVTIPSYIRQKPTTWYM